MIILSFRFFSEYKEKVIVNSYCAFGEKKWKENSATLLNFFSLLMNNEKLCSIRACCWGALKAITFIWPNPFTMFQNNE